jgi:hypothetical protein
MVGSVGGFCETMPTTIFWLLHTGCALCFVIFKIRRWSASSAGREVICIFANTHGWEQASLEQRAL